MARRFEIILEKAGVRAVAELCEEDAPITSAVVWDALPLSGQAYHAKWANNEVFFLVPPFAKQEFGKENATVFPIPGDLLYIPIAPGHKVPPELSEQCRKTGLIDIAIFYGRDNYLLGPEGHMPGNRFAGITEGLKEFAAACNNILRQGGVGETISLRRLDE